MFSRWQNVCLLAIFLQCNAGNIPVTIEGSQSPQVIRATPTTQALTKTIVPAHNNTSNETTSVALNTNELPICRSVADTTEEVNKRSIEINNDSFVLDGTPLLLVTGSLHYFRVPSEYWRDRLRKLKQAGLNGVATYVEWSHHEPKERQYRFDGDYDLVNFVKIAAEEGLLVLLRPGPYICAERDFGGFPFWLLSKYPKIKLRSTDPDYLRESKIWLDKLLEMMKPLLYGNGGPIILLQVENEYGSYGKDKAYMMSVRDMLAGHVGNNALLYTTDGSSSRYYKAGSVNGTLTTIDFGVGYDVPSLFSNLRNFMPKGPLVNSEFYPGWLAHWGEAFPTVGVKYVVDTLKEMLRLKASVNFYVFHGGTNFGFTAGANYFDSYKPDLTSYDYNAPLDEAGDPTPKYDAIREVLEQHFPEVKGLPRPSVSKKAAYGAVTLQPLSRLLSPSGRQKFGINYPKFTGKDLPTFEALLQNSGLILYETTITLNDTNKTRLFKCLSPRDRVYVFLNHELKGIISRMHKIYSVPLEVNKNDILSLLVENQGRINYGLKLHDFKGILQPVTLDRHLLHGEWTITGFPLEELPTLNGTIPIDCNQLTSGPVMYEGTFTVEDEQPLDTFLDTSGWGKGYVWINGHNLGRYWPLEGPQMTLYVPGVWLKHKENKIHLLEIEKAPSNATMTFIDRNILNRLLLRKSQL